MSVDREIEIEQSLERRMRGDVGLLRFRSQRGSYWLSTQTGTHAHRLQLEPRMRRCRCSGCTDEIGLSSEVRTEDAHSASA